ncbi:MAG: hypothetical protein ABRQ37_27085 [Candidatus Eremiobacterota bacterium]
MSDYIIIATRFFNEIEKYPKIREVIWDKIWETLAGSWPSPDDPEKGHLVYILSLDRQFVTDEKINCIKRELEMLQKTVDEQKDIIERQICKLGSLGERDRTLDNIYNSHGWKLLLKYYKLRDRVFPENSSLRDMAKKFLRFLMKVKNRLKSDILLHCDLAKLRENSIEISGWALSPSGINKIEVYLDGKLLEGTGYGLPRTDVGNSHPSIKDSSNSGFYLSCPVGNHTIKSDVKIRVIDNNEKTKQLNLSLMRE